jgi:hypothetical protein
MIDLLMGEAPCAGTVPKPTPDMNPLVAAGSNAGQAGLHHVA